MPKLLRVKWNHEQLDVLDKLCFPYDTPYPRQDSYWWLMHNISFCGLEILPNNTAFLCRSGVHPDWRGKGIQKRLIRVRQRFCRKNGIRRIVTYTSPNNLASANSLISCGYKLYRPDYEFGLPDSLYFIQCIS